LYILTWKRASRHNGVHFFDISTSDWRERAKAVSNLQTKIDAAMVKKLRTAVRSRGMRQWLVFGQDGIGCSLAV